MAVFGEGLQAMFWAAFLTIGMLNNSVQGSAELQLWDDATLNYRILVLLLIELRFDRAYKLREAYLACRHKLLFLVAVLITCTLKRLACALGVNNQKA